MWTIEGKWSVPPLGVFGEQVCRSNCVQGVILLWQAGIESAENKDHDCFSQRQVSGTGACST